MIILLYLYEIRITLPNNPSQLYHHFICLTICRYLAKYGHPLNNNIKELADLQEPYNKKQLCKLSLEALNNNSQLVFTYEEIHPSIQAACPDVIATPEAINDFGLLKAVKTFWPNRKNHNI